MCIDLRDGLYIIVNGKNKLLVHACDVIFFSFEEKEPRYCVCMHLCVCGHPAERGRMSSRLFELVTCGIGEGEKPIRFIHSFIFSFIHLFIHVFMPLIFKVCWASGIVALGIQPWIKEAKNLPSCSWSDWMAPFAQDCPGLSVLSTVGSVAPRHSSGLGRLRWVVALWSLHEEDR